MNSFRGYGIVAITSVFQTEEMGSIPIIRWRLQKECLLRREAQLMICNVRMVSCEATTQTTKPRGRGSASRRALKILRVFSCRIFIAESKCRQGSASRRALAIFMTKPRAAGLGTSCKATNQA